MRTFRTTTGVSTTGKNEEAHEGSHARHLTAF
jgi:hypothetical protein